MKCTGHPCIRSAVKAGNTIKIGTRVKNRTFARTDMAEFFTKLPKPTPNGVQLKQYLGITFSFHQHHKHAKKPVSPRLGNRLGRLADIAFES
jgi:hypothetical protein